MAIERLDWPAPKNIVAGFTTRSEGVSSSPFESFNLAMHVGDNAEHVLQNRTQLDQALPSEKSWQWLEQVHGVDVVEASRCDEVLVADASFSNQKNKVCVVMTADCLPILLCDKKGSEVAAIHAGWRSLCYGVIENAVAKFTTNKGDILAYLGPAIGPDAFEVGEDVKAAFFSQNCGQESLAAFKASDVEGKYLADLYQLARLRLQSVGVTAIYGGGLCTYNDKNRFYSFRRDNVTGRMASFIYRTE